MGNCCSVGDKEELKSGLDLEPAINEQNLNANMEKRYEETIRQIHNDYPELHVTNVFTLSIR